MTTRLYGILWRWHFLAGLAACPVLFVLAITGAAYVFQPELERALSPALFHVEPRGAPLAVDDLVARLPARCQPGSIELEPDRSRTVVVWCQGEPARRVFLDPYSGEVLGEDVVESSLFGFILELHWALLLDERGRLIVEWATSWAILLMISGAYLWWPSRRRGGAWMPRRGVAARQLLRDLHAVFGAYAVPALLAIAASGLCWTRLAGHDRWSVITRDAVSRSWEAPPTSTVVPWTRRIGFDAALAAAGHDRATEQRLVSIGIGKESNAAYRITFAAPGWDRPSVTESVHVDAYDGRVLSRLGWDDRSMLGKVSEAGYAIHVGSILGWPGRVLALAAALVLAGLCVTGPWMWWKRRPAGKLGVPPRARRFAWPLLLVLGALGWLLPAVGWTLMAVVTVELLVLAWRFVAARIGPVVGGR